MYSTVAICCQSGGAVDIAWALLLAGEGEEEQALSLENRSILIENLLHMKRLLGHFDKLQVGSSPLLEAEVYNGILVQFQKCLQRLH